RRRRPREGSAWNEMRSNASPCILPHHSAPCYPSDATVPSKTSPESSPPYPNAGCPLAPRGEVGEQVAQFLVREQVHQTVRHDRRRRRPALDDVARVHLELRPLWIDVGVFVENRANEHASAYATVGGREHPRLIVRRDKVARLQD